MLTRQEQTKSQPYVSQNVEVQTDPLASKKQSKQYNLHQKISK